MRVRGIRPFATGSIAIVGRISGSRKGDFPVVNRPGSTTIECFDKLVIEFEVGDGNGIVGDNGETGNRVIGGESFSGSRTHSPVENIGEIKEVGGYHVDVE